MSGQSPERGAAAGFESAVAAVIKNLPQETVLTAALSGGADSTALVAALAAICGKNLHAVHINHGIRNAEECAGDEGACEALCKKLGVPLAVRRIPPGSVEAYAREHGTGLEGAARRFRYNLLREEARRTSSGAVLTAHTRDDLLETILMAFLRGSGPEGLGAMPAVSKPSGDGPALVRPLLSLSRAGVVAYLEERNLSWRTDTTNADERFFRNRVRKKLIPLLDEYFPHWRDPVRRLGETQALTAAFVAEEAARRLPWKTEEAPGPLETGTGNPALSCPADVFFSQPEILREAALFAAVDALDSPLMETKKPRLEALRIFASGGVKAQDLGPARLERDGSAVRVSRVAQSRHR